MTEIETCLLCRGPAQATCGREHPAGVDPLVRRLFALVVADGKKGGCTTTTYLVNEVGRVNGRLHSATTIRRCLRNMAAHGLIREERKPMISRAYVYSVSR